jgi:hypothetical protein
MKILFAVMLVSALSVGCGTRNDAPSYSGPTSMTITPSSVSYPGPGRYFGITVTLYNQSGSLYTGPVLMTWSRSDSSVNVCDDPQTNPDKITVCAEASGTLTATDGQATASVDISIE